MQDGQKKLFFSLRKSFFPFENMRWMFNKLCEISFKGTSRQPFVFFSLLYFYRFNFLTSSCRSDYMLDATSFSPDPVNDACYRLNIHRLKIDPFKPVLEVG